MTRWELTGKQVGNGTGAAENLGEDAGARGANLVGIAAGNDAVAVARVGAGEGGQGVDHGAGHDGGGNDGEDGLHVCGDDLLDGRSCW